MELLIHTDIACLTHGRYHLSDFSIITGLNGSGKTMLLALLGGDGNQAIHNNNQVELYGDRGQKFTQIKYIPLSSLTASMQLDSIEPDSQNYRGSGKQKNAFQSIWAYYQKVVLPKQKATPGFQRVADKIGKNVFELEYKETEEHYLLSDGIPSQDPFSSRIGEIIGHYEKLKYENAHNQTLNQHYGVESKYLTPQQFVIKYGNHPTPRIKRIFESIGLPYTVVSQPQNYGNTFNVFFKNTITGQVGGQLRMSSGEQILLALSLASFNTEIGSTSDLELLLLDEADATLHPSMIKRLLKTIEEVFVDKGVKVIMTTHSPSTVALASEKAKIYLLEKNPTKLIELPKNDAISRLSDGVPTLSVRIEDRRIVFVESKYDAENFELFFNKVKFLLGTEFSLNFIPSDITGDGDCNKVEDLVNKLNEVPSVYGLIDFDGKKTNKGNLVILGQGNRDGIENYILDPVVLGAYLIRKLIISKADAGLQTGETVEAIARFDDLRLQDFANKISAIILKDKPDQLTVTKIKSGYINGTVIEISEFFAKTDDHVLEEFVIKRFPQLSALNNRNKLSKEILGTIIEDMPGLIPVDIFETLGLLTQK